ncbi:hypothetical protein [Labrys neptuniae]
MAIIPRKSAVRDVALAKGFRSGLEDVVADQIKAELGLSDVEYEAFKVEYLKPARVAKYTPDFRLPNGIIIETKGKFEVEDRQKHILIKNQHPLLDIRFVFSNSRSRIRKGSPTTYAMWCEKNGFLFADKRIPKAWFNEPPRNP